MEYCTIDQWVVIPSTGRMGRIDKIIRRRTPLGDGVVIVQCGADGPWGQGSDERLA